MKKLTQTIAASAALAISMLAAPAFAHFQMIIPSDDMVTHEDSRTVDLDLRFWHPLEGDGMNMVKPNQFGVLIGGKKNIDLLDALKPVKLKDRGGNSLDGFSAEFRMQRGAHVFYVEPKPYWEPEEDSFIIHYTKVINNRLSEDGWDAPVGLKTEIVPLSRPFGLWTGNVFQGQVLMDGKPVPFSEVEVETYDPQGTIHPPTDTMITQVIKADGNGVFTYAMPKAGWWGFAALNSSDTPIQHDGVNKHVELGAVIWVKTYDMN